MLASTMMDTPVTLNLLLERAGGVFRDLELLTRRPDKTLHRCTYGDVYRRSRQLAAALVKAGIKPGDRVATLMWNHYAHLEAYFGIPAAGAVLHTLNLRLHGDDIAYIANHAEDRMLLVDEGLLPLLESFSDQINFERVIVFNYGEPSAKHEDYERFLETGDDLSVLPELEEKWACGMCYTSGTTGKPKGVLYSHKSTVLHALSFSLPDAGNLSVRDSCVPVVPMFHAMAWGMPYAAMMTGSRMALPGQFLDAVNLLDLFQKAQATVTAGVPTIWMSILKELDQSPERWKLVAGMRMVVGGSATPPAMVEAFAKHQLNVIAAWGMTETSPLGSVAQLRPELDDRPAKEHYYYRAQAGLPAPLVDVRIVSEEGIMPWDGTAVGELQVRGPWITGAYYQRPDAADAFTDDGWFRTGDVASISAEGYIHITDRTKDLIKSGGEWISSVELENELMGHPGVAEAVVVAVPHQKWMERPLAVLVKNEGAEVDPDQLKAHLNGKFADWWLPDDYVFVDEIPRNSTGKFMKLKVRQQFAEWQWSSAS